MASCLYAVARSCHAAVGEQQHVVPSAIHDILEDPLTLVAPTSAVVFGVAKGPTCSLCAAAECTWGKSPSTLNNKIVTQVRW